MKTRNIIKRISAFALAIMAVFPVFGSLTVRADAVTDYANTAVLDDLKTLSGFSSADYPKVPLEDGEDPCVRVIQFSEYCYSSHGAYDEFYGLYLYVYNPSETPIYPSAHYANVAIAYNSEGEPSAYGNVALDLCSNYNNRFFKFKIADSTAFRTLSKAYAEAHEGTRRYDIAGVQLSFTNDYYELDSTYARTYYFTGYGKGMSPTTELESTLACTSTHLDTLDLDVQHTYYRSDFKDKVVDVGQGIDVYSKCVADEVNTVYFSVPNEVFEKYGEKLQKIKAEWYEYKTTPIFATTDSEAYEALRYYMGVEIGERNDELPWRVLWESYSMLGLGGSLAEAFGYAYNGEVNGTYMYGTSSWLGAKPVTRMDWLFQVENIDDFRVDREKLIAHMEWYTQRYNDLPKVDTLGTAKYAENLFAPSIDENRVQYLEGNTETVTRSTRGHMVQEIDADKTGTFLFEKNQSAWNKYWHGSKYEEQSYSPIEVIEDISAFNGMSAEMFAETYYVNTADAPDVLQYCKDELNAGRKPVLFRFAQTEYYASEARFDYDGNVAFSPVDGYVAQETMFLGFDIISLTFRKDNNVETVLAVTADPMDIINNVTPPSDFTARGNWSLDTFVSNVLLFVGVVGGCLLVFMLGNKIIGYFKK